MLCPDRNREEGSKYCGKIVLPLSCFVSEATEHYNKPYMESAKYIYWQDNNQWLGYLQDYPDYWTQGESFEDLQSHLRDLYRDLTSGEIPGVRKLAELTLR